MPIPYDLLALAAAACWAIASILSVAPARHLGAFAFSRWRMLIVASVLWCISLASGGWQSVQPNLVWSMAASGLIGIFIGDTALFSALNRLGPRRAGVLFASHSAFSALLAYAVFDERMSGQTLVGALLTVSGVMCAMLFGKRSEERHDWEADRGDVGVGVALGLLAALCQAGGTLIAKPAMGAGVDPVSASAIRMSTACLAHWAILALGVSAARAHQPLNLKVLGQTALNGLVAMGLGMTLILLALKHGNVGMVAILSSVSPVLVLPLLWWRLGRAPASGAWLGAGLTVLGTVLILSR
ncbi:DMT family transporter [Chitinimonas sp.]|uniref:DMT family transporter n=1 Tax=Chitinimonas sp. TaxID=1934313 RepID=UPI002F922660